MKISKLYTAICAVALSAASLTSCTDYLDKSPDSDISATDAYKDFQNFQGFTEELYNCIPYFSKGYWTNSWNWGEDEIMNVGIDYHMVYKVDQGDFWGWQSDYDGWKSGWMDGGTNGDFVPNDDNRFTKMSLWKGAWYAIRKANIGLQNLDLMTDATQEEKNLIKGQLLFFRGWFYFELMQYFGGLPYFTEPLSATQEFNAPRLNYQETADLAAKDMKEAAELLPMNWDKTSVGANTYGKNQIRITKAAALAFLGKNDLFAGSPLMNKESQGVADYNAEYCKKAADELGELITLVESGNTQYGLLPWKEVSYNFYTIDQGGHIPGSSKDGSVTEALLLGPDYGWNESNWGQSKQYGSKCLNDAGVTSLPTANYVNYYGMANGLPLDDPDSGFDKTHPWKNRDPRFYKDIIYDGERVVTKNLEGDDAWRQYADLQTNGKFRDEKEGSRTGYFLYKFIDKTCNKYDDGYGWSHHFNLHLPWMRLAEVYLLYAEAVTEGYGSPSAKASTCSLSAIDAVNKIRERSGVAGVNAKFTGDKEKFMSELRRERAVELAFEGQRFNDLRRWLLLDKYPYNIKTSQEFLRVGDIDPEKDSKDEQVSGWSEKQILKRDFAEKHYWLPLKKKDCQIYPEFKQNPGW